MEAKHKFELILTALRNEIQNGTYPSGGRFPSEYELADRFGVNKMTANKAVSQLVYEGYLQRGGRGSNTKVIMTEKIPKGYFAYVASLVHEANCQFLTGIENYAFAHGYSVIFLAPPVDALASCISRLQHPDIVGIMTTSYGILDVPGKNVLHLGLHCRNPIVYTMQFVLIFMMLEQKCFRICLIKDIVKFFYIIIHSVFPAQHHCGWLAQKKQC